MGLVGCYTLHLYCDGPHHPYSDPGGTHNPAEFTERTYATCRRDARREGWLIDAKGSPRKHGTGNTICPKCRKAAREGWGRDGGG